MLNQIIDIGKLDKNSADYRKKCYEIAGKLNHFSMPNPTDESKNVRREYEKSAFFVTNYRNLKSPGKFYRNESQNNLDNKLVLKRIKSKGVSVFAVYGKEDGIFSKKQLQDLRKIVGYRNFTTIHNCSYYLFADQNSEFLRFIEDKISSR